MRIILIVQFLIIALGAYYIYTLKEPAAVVEPGLVPAASVAPTTQTSNQDEETEITTESNGVDDTPSVSGGTDVGMEYPDFDPDIQAQ